MMYVSIVNRGNWRNPANFKGLDYYFAFEAEPYHHVMMTVYTTQNSMADINDLFFLGNYFDAYLKFLEDEEELEVQFA